MFDAEVDLATAKGWEPTVVFGSEAADYDFTALRLTTPTRSSCGKPRPRPGTGTEMFKTIWFDDNLDGKILKDTEDRPDG